MAPCTRCGAKRKFLCPQCGGTAARGGVILAALLLACVVVWFAAKHAGNRSATAPGTVAQSSQVTASGQSHAKPSPLGYANEQPKVAPQPVRPLPTSSAPDSAPAIPSILGPDATMNPPASPAVPVGAPSTPFATSFAASREGFSNGCDSGMLAFRGSTMTFTCPSDPSKSVTVQAASVIGLDGNGILVQPRQKYHFNAKGKSKGDITATFSRWLAASRGAQ